MAKKNQTPKTLKLIVTEEHLTKNPDLVEQGVKVGEEIEIPNPDYIEPQTSKKHDSKVTVNFGVYIPSMGKSYTKEEIAADQNIINYLIEIKSEAVTVN